MKDLKKVEEAFKNLGFVTEVSESSNSFHVQGKKEGIRVQFTYRVYGDGIIDEYLGASSQTVHGSFVNKYNNLERVFNDLCASHCYRDRNHMYFELYKEEDFDEIIESYKKVEELFNEIY